MAKKEKFVPAWYEDPAPAEAGARSSNGAIRGLQAP